MKVKVFTLGFCNANIFHRTMTELYLNSKHLDINYDHYFLWQHYPLPSVEENLKETQKICGKFGIQWMDAGYDTGFSNGWNYLTSVVNPSDNEIIICFDPDEWPLTPGWDKALIDVLMGDPKLAFCSLDNVHALGDSPGLHCEAKRSGNHRIMIPVNRPTMIGLTAFKMSWLKQIGGMQQPTTHYGHLESHLWSNLIKTKMQYCILLDYKESYSHGIPHDSQYTKYKREQASFKTKIPFEEWLKNDQNNTGNNS